MPDKTMTAKPYQAQFCEECKFTDAPPFAENDRTKPLRTVEAVLEDLGLGTPHLPGGAA